MKKFLFTAVVLSFVILMTMSAFAHTPGINILTGDENPLTFDESNTLPSFVENAVIADSPFENEEGNAIMHYLESSGEYAAIGFKINPAADKDRAYGISFKIYQKADEGYGKYKNLWIMKNGMGGWQRVQNCGGFTANSAGGWLKYSYLVDTFDDLVHSTTGATDTTAISKILFEWRYDSASAACINQKIYMDDISIIPAYFVTYKGEDGNNVRSGYEVLTGEKYSPEVTLDDKALGIIGWSAENDNTADEYIALSGNDFTLYAVYDNTFYFNLSSDKNLLTSVGDKAVITADPEYRKGLDTITLSYSVAEGADFITLTDNGDGTAKVISNSEGLSEIVCTSSTGDSDVIYILSEYEEGKNTMKIVNSVSEITSDAQSINVKAVLFSEDAGKKIKWKSSSDCVTVSSNGDGNATLSPVSNGEATITAYAENDESICDSFTVTVSGQKQKEKVYELNVLVWGASLAKHPPAENLYWYGNWGMAASKEENDFIHRLVYYLEEEYYPSKVNLRILAESGFDTSINNDTSASTDYSENQYFLNMENAIKEHNPNIIVTIRTGNLSNDVPVDIAYNAYSQLYDMVYSHVPDAIVVAHHCLLHHDSMKEELYSRLDERYEDRIFEVHDLDVHSDESNLAREWLELGQQAVANHWNDKGHDEVAKVTMNYLNRHIPSVLTPSFVYRPESITVSGKNTISEKGAAVQLYVTALPENTSNSVIWTSSNEKVATVSKNGLVSAHNNGTVTITATSTFDESIYDEYTVTVTNQPAVYTLTYSKNTEDTVSGMPEDDEYAKGEYTLTDIVPEREYYTFIGWGLTKDAQRPVKKFEITENTTVYALWKKTAGFEFEGTYTEDKGFSYGFDIDGGFHVEVKDSCLFTVCTSGEKVRFNSPALDIQNKNFVSFSLSCGYFDENSKAELTVKTQNGEETYLFPILSDGFVTYIADISTLSGNITGFEIYVNSAPADASMFNIALDYVRFSPAKIIDKKNGEFVATDSKTILSSIVYSNSTELDATKTLLITFGDNSYEIINGEKVYVLSDTVGENIGINEISYNAKGKYSSSTLTVYTSTADGLVENTALSSKLTSYDKNEMRLGEFSGIRAKASVTSDFYLQENVEEYGFAVARLDSITSGKITDVILDSNYIDKNLVLYGIGYSKENGTHKIFESNDTTEFFTAVLLNVPKTKSALTKDLVFRPYVKLSDGSILYGAKIETSVFDVAVSLYFDAVSSEQVKAYAKSILDICEFDESEVYIPLDDLWS